MRHKLLILYLVALIAAMATVTNGQITSATSGNWSAGATWVGGTVPAASDNVVIAAGHTVTIDPTAAVCNNLTVNGAGILKFRNDGTAAGITVNGNLIVSGNTTVGGAYGKFMSDSLAAPVAFTAHTLTLYGNLNTGAGVDSSGSIIFRMGSTSATTTLNTAQGCNVTFAGTGNSVITLQKTIYTPTLELFNGTVINKTGGAKVVLSGGNLFQNTNSTTGSAYLIFTSGMVETGASNIWVVLVTAAAGLNTATSTMYVNGNLGRGITSSGGNRHFGVGDANGYRPIQIYPVATAYASQQYLVVRATSGNANTGSSAFTGGIDKVSAVRYYKVTYYQGASATPSFSYSYCYLYYGTDDGVTAGNTNLRVAYSADNRATWNGVGNSAHTTSLTAPPTEIRATALAGGNPVLSDGQSMFIVLARATGTIENSLEPGGTSVGENTGNPLTFVLCQNYPNPFNPSTTIRYGLPTRSPLTLTVFNTLGQHVALLQNGEQEAGYHEVKFDGSDLSSGVYFYRLRAGDFVETRRFLLIR
jgi:hypothetical protein